MADLAPPGVLTAEATGDAGPDGAAELHPDELACVADAVAERRREFTTVRGCARRALAGLGVAPVALVPGPMGAPAWPDGVVGSMTHCRGYRAAAVARSAAYASLGVDAEPVEPLAPAVARRALRAAERARLAEVFPPGGEAAARRLAVSAKEAAYKAFSPWLGRRFGFADFTVELLPTGVFTARPPAPVPFRSAGGEGVFTGRWAVGQGILLTLLALPAVPPGSC
ncbi:4'-phosphopantetheinyl transferase superfamily protein [Streptomyces sp. C10-9-1]|uniref:4'-phosphopantetheinyl transferase family protein n=1 Tax=Streptomyces sp. C10-9-1 TaxID=1859285 RepID=UPI00211317AE|nr:4'-phosphopantetheinyl transferase superfamily protein [Streptomyces sp. C10-9-1]MCQ6556396.1 4'-phosphopantetheinyl transferase superfamily protein [Streptomyces sp. C10-9-1]